tara:strand:+ start:2385 stop:4259 length:1875 start_codon:yes stop_codon:yes gene_type:complete
MTNQLFIPIVFLLSFFLNIQYLDAKENHGLSLYGSEGLKYKHGEAYDHANPNAYKGGHLVLSAFGQFTKLNPSSLKGVTAPGIAQMVFETPMDTSNDDDEPFALYASLIESVELAEDRMSMVYNINPKAKFSDGHPVTADDFVFSLNLRENPEFHPFYKNYFKDIDKAEKLNDRKVKYIFKIYNQELPLITGQMPIFPKHIYGKSGKKFGSDFDEIAIGSGPYLVEQFEFGKYITYKKNPNWWAKSLPINKGRYNFDRITWKIYLDPVAIREAFKGGEIDANLIGSSRDWALDYKGDFEKKGYYVRAKIPHKRVAGMQGYAMNTRNNILKSRKTRAALAMVFDFDWSNKNLFYGQYTRNLCYFDNNPEMKSRGIPSGDVKILLTKLRKKYGSAVPKTALTKPVSSPGQGISFSRNVIVANKLLDSGGWKIGANGIRNKKGTPLALTLLLDNPQWQRISEPYKNNLRKIGVDLEIKLVQVAEYEEKVRNFKYDMIVANFPQSRSPGNEQRNMWGRESAKLPGSRNFMGIENPALDELIDLIVKAKTRKELINTIQAMDRILTHQFYIVPHWYISYDRVVYWNKISGPIKNPSQSNILNNILEWWWFDKEKAIKLKSARTSGDPIK